MNEWIDELSDVAASGEPAVLVTVAGIRGSAPREVGAKMIVTATQTIGTIGGGQLEYQSTRIAAGLLESRELIVRPFPLGSSMGQCCGGVVDILFEPIGDGYPAWLRDLTALHGQQVPAIVATHLSSPVPAKAVITADEVYGNDAPDQAIVERGRELLESRAKPLRDDHFFFEPIVIADLNIAVFGAGHVGAAVVNALATIDCNIRWIDSRRKMFRAVPGNVRAVVASEPALEVAAMPPGSYFLVMTHSHALDYEICGRILNRRDARYCGLIGSRSKRRRFEKRYRQQGLEENLIERLVCPIGMTGISGKKPAEIAVAVAAEILELRDRMSASEAEILPDNVRPLRG